MKKILAVILVLAGTAGAALTLRTWSSGASTDMNNAANWTGGAGALSATDSLVSDGTSAINATATAAVSCGYFRTGGAYLGAISFSGQTLTVVSGMNLAHAGTSNLGNGITMSGNGALVFGSGIGVVTGTSCAVTMNGHDTITDNKSITIGPLTIAASKQCKMGGSGGTTITGATTLLTMGDNSSLNKTSNGSLTFTPTANMTVFSLGTGVVINGAATNYFALGGGATNLKITIPAITLTGIVLPFLMATSSTYVDTFLLDGTFNSTQGILTYSYSTSHFIFDANGQNVTCGSVALGGMNGSTWKRGSGTWNITSFTGTTYNQATIDSLQTAIINCSGSWANGSNNILVPGTSVVTIDSTGTVTSAGKSFYRFRVNTTGATTVTLADVFAASDSLVLTDGKLSAVDTVHAAQLAINSADSSKFAKPVLITGNALFNGGYFIPALATLVGGDIDVTAGYNKFRRDSCGGDLTITSTDSTIYNSGDTTFIGGDMTIGAGALVKSTGHIFKFLVGVTHTITTNGVSMTGAKFVGKNLTFVGSISCIPIISDAGTITIGAGTTLTAGAGYDLQGSAGQSVILRSGTAGTRATLTLPATAGFGYADFKDIIATLTIFADITCKNSGNNVRIIFAASRQCMGRAGLNVGLMLGL